MAHFTFRNGHRGNVLVDAVTRTSWLRKFIKYFLCTSRGIKDMRQTLNLHIWRKDWDNAFSEYATWDSTVKGRTELYCVLVV